MKNLTLKKRIFVGGGSSQSNYKYYNKDEQRIFAITRGFATKENLIKVEKNCPTHMGFNVDIQTSQIK